TPAAPKGPLGKALAAAKETLTGVKETPTQQETPAAPSTPSISSPTVGATPGYNPDAPGPTNTIAGRTVSPGIGLANLATPQNPNTLGTTNTQNVSYGMGNKRPERPDDAITGKIRDVVDQV